MLRTTVKTRQHCRLAFQKLVLRDLGLTGEPHTVLPVWEAFKEQAISLRYPVYPVGNFLHLLSQPQAHA